MARKRTDQNDDLPPFLYRVIDRHGQTRYQFQRVDGTRVMFPQGMKLNLIRMQSANYNIKYRNMEVILGHKKQTPQRARSASKFDLELSEAISKIMVQIEREELSEAYMAKYRYTMTKLSNELGNVFTRSLNLELINEFLLNHYETTSAKNFNNILAHIKKLTSYLADSTYILDDFMRNKKNRKVTRSEAKKTRQPLTMEEFTTIFHASPTYLKVAMLLAFETTHAVKEITRIKHTIKQPKEGTCGIVWNQNRKPTSLDGIEVFGTLYIHRQKSHFHDSSRVAIPVTQGIVNAIELAKTDRLVCPYAVRRRPRQSQREVDKNNDHPFQIDSQYLSKAFSKIRDNIGIKAHLIKAERPTFHEIRGLAAREFERRGYNPSARMAQGNIKTTEIYTKSHEPEWNHVPPIDIWQNEPTNAITDLHAL